MALTRQQLSRLVTFMTKNRENVCKMDLIQYLEEKICQYSIQQDRNSEQIRGMNILLRDIMSIDSRLLEDK